MKENKRVYAVIFDVWGKAYVRKSRFDKFVYEEICIMLGSDAIDFMKLNVNQLHFNEKFYIKKPYYFFNPNAINIPLEPNEHAYNWLKPLGVTELSLGNVVFIDSKKFEKWKK